MIKPERWGYWSEEAKVEIKTAILNVVRKWREELGESDVKDYIMIQPHTIILHNGKNTLGNSRYTNKLSFTVYGSDGVISGPQVKAVTDELFLNEEFIAELRKALEEL